MKETAALSNVDSLSVSDSIKKVKMDDRKRPLNDQNDESQPQSKRQAVTAPSTSSTVPLSQEEVVNFQKEAIYRQMQVYKREKELAETRLEELVKKGTYHDNHLRVIDAWWQQLIDELRLVADAEIASQASIDEASNNEFPSSLLFENDEAFQEHIASKKSYIVDNLSTLFKSMKFGKDDITAEEKITKLERHIANLLSTEKTYKVQLKSLQSEKDDYKQQLTDAAIRYLSAEKKLDRLRSSTLAKIERQAIQQSTPEAKNENKSNDTNSVDAKATDTQLADADLARKEAQAIASKQEKEIKQLQSDNTRLTEQVSKYTIKLSRLSEEDIQACDVFKNVKSKLDDLVVRYNHIEALNNNLVEETKKLQSERTSHKLMLEREQENALVEMNTQMSKNESDLARVRHVRDDAVQDLAIKKAALDKHLSVAEGVNELATARASRMESLEAECKRLQLQLSESKPLPDPNDASLTLDELLPKYTQLSGAYKILEEELAALEAAFKKAHDLGSEKVINLQEASVKMDRLVQEKAKADQKFFGAMKAKETLQQENKMLKNQHAKSSEIIAQLKDAEKSVTAMVSNLEKQISELKNIEKLAATREKDYQRRILEGTTTVESLKSQVNRLTDAMKSKDSAFSSESEARRKAESDLEKMTVKFDNVEQKYESQMRQVSSDEHVEALQSMVRCTVCRMRLKNTVISVCGHVFCRDCAEERITSRSRKCPNCGRPFARNDILTIHL